MLTAEDRWTVAEAAAARALEQRELDAELAEAGGEDIPENVREQMLRNTQFDAETPTRRALQRFEVLSLSHGRFADLSQLAEMGASRRPCGRARRGQRAAELLLPLRARL